MELAGQGRGGSGAQSVFWLIHAKFVLPSVKTVLLRNAGYRAVVDMGDNLLCIGAYIAQFVDFRKVTD